jgi:hypothetical protein
MYIVPKNCYKGQRKGWGEILTDKAKVEKGSANCICELGYASTCPIHGDPDAIRELPPLWKWYVIDPGTPVSEIVQKYAWNIGEELNLNRVQVGLLGYFIQRRENAILAEARKEATAAALEEIIEYILESKATLHEAYGPGPEYIGGWNAAVKYIAETLPSQFPKEKNL